MWFFVQRSFANCLHFAILRHFKVFIPKALRLPHPQLWEKIQQLQEVWQLLMSRLLHPLMSPVTLRWFGRRQPKCVMSSHVKIFQRRNFCLILASGSLTQGFASEGVPESCFTMMQPMRSGRKLSRWLFILPAGRMYWMDIEFSQTILSSRWQEMTGEM